jgi:hypothetical protein
MKDEGAIRDHLQAYFRQYPKFRLKPGLDPCLMLPIGGYIGQPCFACEEPITTSDFATTTCYRYPAGHVIWFHVQCHIIWEEERRRYPKRDA